MIQVQKIKAFQHSFVRMGRGLILGLMGIVASFAHAEDLTISYDADDNLSEYYTGEAEHGINVIVSSPTNAKVQYSETGADGTWVDALGYKDVCTDKVMYFKITSEGYTTVVDSRKVTINPKQINNEVAWLIFEDEDGYVYDGTAKEPDTECSDGNPSKITADDYEVTYENNVNAGTARAKFTGKGNYTGTFYEEFEILPRSITLTSGSASKTYDGTALTEKTMTVGGDGFIAGQGATYTYTGMQLAVGESDNTFTYTFNDGTLESNYEITPAYGKLTITPATIDYIAEDNNPSEVYTGAADHKISVTVTKPTNAKVQYSETGADGTWVDTLGYKDVCTDKLMYFKITSEGYTTVVDSRKVTIQPKQISNQIAWLVFESEDGYVYDGTAKEPGTECGDGNPSKITVDDYEVTYESNVNAGTARAKFTGKGNYMGMFYEEFEILPRSITLTSGSASKTYDGTALTEKTMTVGGDGFVAGQGATYTYTGTQLAVGESNNTFTYTFKDGTLESNYEITSAYGKLMINKATINNGDGEPGDGTIPTDGTSKFDVTAEYDGEGHTLDTAALSEAFTAAVVGGTIDCTYALSSDATATWQVTPPTFTNAGTYSVWYKISAANYDDFIHEAKVTITSRNISHATIAPLENANYTGSPIQPTPTVTDGMPSIITTDDYVISYANNTDVGTATLTLTGTRNYTGTTSATFEIISTSIQYATLSGTLAWKLNLGSGCYTAQLKLTCTEGLANGISKLRFIYQDRTSGTTLTSALYNSAARANRPTTTYAGTIYRYVDLDATRITAENAVVIYGVQDVTQPRGIVKKDECLIELYVRSLSTPVSDLGYVTWTSNGKECMLPITAAGGSQGIEVSAAMTTARQIVTSFSPTSSPLSLAALNQSLAMGTVLDAASNPYCKLVEFSVSSTAVQGRIEVGKENTNGEQTQGKLGTNAQVILMGAQSLDANFEELGRIKTAADGRFTFNLEKSGYHFFKVRLDIQDAIN